MERHGNGIRRFHADDVHRIYWNENKDWTWIQISHKYVAKYEQKFQFSKDDAIWNILKKYIPEKPTNDTIMKFGTSMFSKEKCGNLC